MDDEPQDKGALLLIDAAALREALDASQVRYERLAAQLGAALHRSHLTFVVLVLIVAAAIAAMFQTTTQRSAEIEHLDRQGEQILDIIADHEEQSGAIERSLEILENRDTVVRGMVVQIDCNNRQALQEVIDQFDPPPGITVITPECIEATG